MREILQELSRFAMHLITNITRIGQRIKNEIEELNPEKPIVVLVPGYTISYGRLGLIMKKRFEDEGFSVFVFDPGKTTSKDIKDLASELRDFVEEICQKHDIDKVSLVAHSMGGVIAQYYVQKFGGNERVKKVFAVGSPFHGTRTAYLVIHTKAGRQLLPKSKFFQELNKDKRYLDKFVSIRARRDQFIKPKSSSILDQAKNIEIPVVGHITLMFSDKVVDIIKKELSR